MSLVTLALQVAFSEIKHTVWSSGEQPSSLQNNAKEMVIFSNLYAHLIFIIYFSPMENSFPVSSRQWQINTRKRHPLYRSARTVEAPYLCSVQMMQCSYIHLPHINYKLSSQQLSNNSLCLFNVVPVLLHVFHVSVSRGLKKNSSFHLSEVNFSDEPRAQALTK